ncbi:hypothetical protein B6U98_03475 [Thermoplasmatales archaeon ex4572_165]|nr:MAG: hypothetical protein B6U98_03475 [Thermoplasmatales archaeon ex4572_165]RLF57790.1 MAG: hypothetical protein DRN27_07050 [Thermoplasmata archaeon]
MAFVRAKKRGDKIYYYLVEGKRVDGKVKQKVLEYLGPNPKVVKATLDKAKTKVLAETVFLEDIRTSDELKSCLDRIGISYPESDIVEMNVSHKIGGKKINLFLYFAASEEV